MYHNIICHTPEDLLHRIYKIILHVIYYDTYINHFTNIRDPQYTSINISNLTPFLTGSLFVNRYDLENPPVTPKPTT